MLKRLRKLPGRGRNKPPWSRAGCVPRTFKGRDGDSVAKPNSQVPDARPEGKGHVWERLVALVLLVPRKSPGLPYGAALLLLGPLSFVSGHP
jgi:hypothetical protein